MQKIGKIFNKKIFRHLNKNRKTLGTQRLRDDNIEKISGDVVIKNVKDVIEDEIKILNLASIIPAYKHIKGANLFLKNLKIWLKIPMFQQHYKGLILLMYEFQKS